MVEILKHAQSSFYPISFFFEFSIRGIFIPAHKKHSSSYKSYVTSAGHLGENCVQPTVLADMTHDMRLASEKTFRPVAALFAFDEEEEAIREENRCEVALGLISILGA
ncbi:unnamed protein product [Aspergillus oryzae RIB40]|uniref:DNA, SC009 n=2 Tax=Aspergillus oryzae TaxID=5062 RepID=Q2UUK7_ASPOR|nr:unnamed protein product [Aspergillus oryzae RIB40]EIT79253.1 hypothetical protein Ao3042_04418 [Aspergillus oryzae 3.042]KDE83701.1 hypothetical protein AO1008_10407 [Aspergillus oryzae 100-8]BAE54758.1 unnamed protein product [Aspergillus oryzae RIB40]|eukprot:EIT79253.1 hypothetical protein Ao3042_04418 [Aspergillus oryzae 3.042]